MITHGKQLITPWPNVNNKILELTGDLEDNLAKSTLAEFLTFNPGFTWELMTGNKLFEFQEILIRSWLAKNFNLNIVSRGGSKCISYSDKNFIIDKKRGLIPIIDFIKEIRFEEDNNKWISIEPRNIWTGTQWYKIDKYLPQFNKKCYSIITKKGFSLEGSENHLVRVINFGNNNCNIIWKKYSEITENDYICIDRNDINWGGDEKAKDLQEAYLLGLLIGDGCITLDNFYFCSSDEALLKTATEITGFSQTKASDRHYRIYFSREYSRYLAYKYNLNKEKAQNKVIPKKVLSSKVLLREFVAGLFDCDGSARKDGKITLVSVSQQLCQEVHNILLAFGIISSFKGYKVKNPNWNKRYEVKIYGKDAKRFFELIGFRLPQKQAFAEYFETTKNNHSRKDVIPNANMALKKIKQKYKFSDEQSKLWNKYFIKNDDNLTYDSLGFYVSLFREAGVDNNDLRDLNEILNKNYFFDKVERKEGFCSNTIDFNIPNEECYWSNGFISHNTYLVSIFCALYPIFNPSTQIVIASSGFRRSRAILEQMDVFLKADGASLLRQCYPHELKRRNDEYRIGFGEGGYIVAIPLNENARGFRGQVLICDEGLLISEEMFRAVLMPFIVARSGIKEILQIKEIEDYLVDRGLLKEENKEFIKSTKKIIMLSSASFKFQFLYNLYESWIKKIIEGIKGDEKLGGSYFVGRLSYEALPNELIDSTVINEAKSGGMNHSTFQREYQATFSDDSSGFYSAAKMNLCTILDGEFPCVELKADPTAKYILTLDSNMSESQSSDHHAMSLFKLSPETRSVTLVHAYAKAGKSFKEYAKYFYYLLVAFKPILIWTDKTGGGERFVASANETPLFKEGKLKINKWSADFEAEDYPKAIRESKLTYNYESKNILYGQVFTSESIGKMADTLQVAINNKKVWFASPLSAQITALEDARATLPDYIFDGNKEQGLVEAVDDLDDNITLTKSETALIEVSVTPLGTRVFNLPQHLRRSESTTRARRDSHTCLAMGTYAAKIWFDRMEQKEESTTFQPMFLR